MTDSISMNYFKQYSPKKTDDALCYQIPKKIFMTWEKHQLTDAMYNNIQEWIKLNPDWELHLYSDDDCIQFIQSHFDNDVFEAYTNLYPTAYKADLFRYCVLYLYGGVYSDVKIVPLQPIAHILSEDIDFLSVKDRFSKGLEFDGYIFQTFLCAKPYHPFFKKSIDLIVENSKNNNYGNDPLSPTGPGLIAKAINLSLDRPANSTITTGKQNIQGFKFELLSVKNHSIIDATGNIFSLNAYKSYRQELANTGQVAKHYSLCWFNNKVYVKQNKPRFQSQYYLKKKPLWVVTYHYFVGNIAKARKAAITYCFSRPLLAQRLIKKIMFYEKQLKK